MPQSFFIFPSTSSVASTETILHPFWFCCMVKCSRKRVKCRACVYSQHAFGLAEDPTTSFCEVSSKKIFRKGPVFPGTIKCIGNKSEVNGKIQGCLLKRKAIYTHRDYVSLSSKICPILVFPSLKFTHLFSYLLSFSLAQAVSLPQVWTHLQWHRWSLCRTCSSPQCCISQSRVWTQ